MTQNWQTSPSEVQPAYRQTLCSPSPSPLLPSADQYGNDSSFANTPLISPPSHHRHLPPLAGLPTDASQLPHPPTATLFSHQFSYPQQHRRGNVVPFPLNPASTRGPPETHPSHGSPSFFDIQSFALPSYPTQNVPVNPTSTRPRTSHPVFHSTSALAAHHGIPQSLPPVPRTSKFATVSSPAAPSAPAPPVASSSSDFDFSSLCTNYLTMLQQKHEEPHSSEVSADADTVQAIMDVIQGTPHFIHTGSAGTHRLSASPEFRMANDFNEFLTSPMDDSPFEDFLTTPALESADIGSDMLTSPAIFDADNFPDMDAAIFGAGGLLSPAFESSKLPSSAHHGPPLPHPAFDFDGLLTMPSPMTPSLDPASLHPSPHTQPLNAADDAQHHPDALVSMDAPIQKRSYITPSATSRKEVPAAWIKKKRARSQAFEEDELEEDPSLAPDDVDAIEAKRRQNTLAARRSRKRKLEYQRELEASVEREKEEKEMWRQRAMLFKALLESHGHDVPTFEM
ncbi:uncharacterized protein BXZ73DRAFT_93056 [Epithele typhae]|uniref:uncharacterized protein n=1 Tax=Epithele typhae TaxID=378194 RepID=UPI00200811F1|nr:uncharacterized protein BXZ73DRAFT_93056 [Epithele typhae]KAH9912854.1 hypothetical protein BXZ73DRAFT_93056 [Epithele typhae]